MIGFARFALHPPGDSIAMSKLTAAAVLALAAVACSSKPTWTEYKNGPITVQFPCAPETAAAATKCMRSDGTVYKLDVVDKSMSAEDALKEAKDYAEQAQKAELLQTDKYPVKWREARRSTGVESWLYFKDNKEYTVSVEWSTQAEPAEAAEFFSKVQMQ